MCLGSDRPVPGTDFESSGSSQVYHISPHHEMSVFFRTCLPLFHGNDCLQVVAETHSCKAAASIYVIRTIHNNSQTMTENNSVKLSLGTVPSQVTIPSWTSVLFPGHPWSVQTLTNSAPVRAVWIEGTGTCKVRARECVSVGVLLISVLSWPLSTQHVNVQMDCGLNLKGGFRVPHLNSLSLLLSFSLWILPMVTLCV